MKKRTKFTPAPAANPTSSADQLIRKRPGPIKRSLRPGGSNTPPELLSTRFIVVGLTAILSHPAFTWPLFDASVIKEFQNK
jgi:hypothetical protein